MWTRDKEHNDMLVMKFCKCGRCNSIQYTVMLIDVKASPTVYKITCTKCGECGPAKYQPVDAYTSWMRHSWNSLRDRTFINKLPALSNRLIRR